MMGFSEIKTKKYSLWMKYFIIGASCAALIFIIVVSILYFTLNLSIRNLFISLCLGNIILGIIPGLISKKEELFSF